jgi:hypothetical protein
MGSFIYREKSRMPLKDIEVKMNGITPRQHTIRHSVNTGRAKYPFKAMIIGDYISVGSQKEAENIRHALKSFYKRIANRRFTVRQPMEDDNVWICRRIS